MQLGSLLLPLLPLLKNAEALFGLMFTWLPVYPSLSTDSKPYSLAVRYGTLPMPVCLARLPVMVGQHRHQPEGRYCGSPRGTRAARRVGKTFPLSTASILAHPIVWEEEKSAQRTGAFEANEMLYRMNPVMIGTTITNNNKQRKSSVYI
ncbi:hypothetical protein B9Z19DRAFT_627147 [Tuber borchii]|uniref:Secreted protein n=1 Tax=Tuber borchii TaxID=42251 RepID=A0A2T7A0U8_TUBBO|nr:hypothetical protein B9Z19DRAFT_627147 [Tuber borchii]